MLASGKQLTPNERLPAVEVCLSASPLALTPVPREQLEILLRIGVKVAPRRPGTAMPDLVLDAILGYSQSGDPRGAAAELIEWTAERRVLALDNPSSLELSTGQVRSPAVRAAATMTLALPKDGLRVSGVAAHVGEVYLADISVPTLVHERLGLNYRSSLRWQPDRARRLTRGPHDVRCTRR